MGDGSLPAALYVNKIKKLSNLQVHCNVNMGPTWITGEGVSRGGRPGRHSGNRDMAIAWKLLKMCLCSLSAYGN